MKVLSKNSGKEIKAKSGQIFTIESNYFILTKMQNNSKNYYNMVSLDSGEVFFNESRTMLEVTDPHLGVRFISKNLPSFIKKYDITED